jgi:hypothetical protein
VKERPPLKFPFREKPVPYSEINSKANLLIWIDGSTFNLLITIEEKNEKRYVPCCCLDRVVFWQLNFWQGNSDHWLVNDTECF